MIELLWNFSDLCKIKNSQKGGESIMLKFLNYRSHLYQLMFAEWKALHLEYCVPSQLSKSRNTSLHARYRQERQRRQLCRDGADCWVFRWQELVRSGLFRIRIIANISQTNLSFKFQGKVSICRFKWMEFDITGLQTDSLKWSNKGPSILPSVLVHVATGLVGIALQTIEVIYKTLNCRG